MRVWRPLKYKNVYIVIGPQVSAFVRSEKKSYQILETSNATYGC